MLKKIFRHEIFRKPRKYLNLYFLRKLGFVLKRAEELEPAIDPAMEKDFLEIFRSLEGMHHQTIERLYSLYQAVGYVQRAGIEGDFVECGVLKGASEILMAKALLAMNCTDRRIFLFDTFDGMEPPGDRDFEFSSGKHFSEVLKRLQKREWKEWSNCPLEKVRESVFKTGYPRKKFVFVEGRVEDTLPANCPDKISILRLDTDWYGSTYHELVHLFPLLAPGGVLIIDDYGYCSGCKEAVDRYFSEIRQPVFLNRIDSHGRIAIKGLSGKKAHEKFPEMFAAGTPQLRV